MASRSLGVLTLDLIAKIGGFQQGMDQGARIAESRSRAIQKSFVGLKTAVAGAFAAIGGAALVHKIIDATAESEKALAQLNQRLVSTKGAAGLTSKELTDLASSLQDVTTFEDDTTVAAEGLLLAFTNIKGDNFKRATESALDLSTALNQDLQSSIVLVGKALNNPTKGLAALAKAGVQLDASQQKVIKRLAETGRLAEAQGLILDALKGKFGGAARAAADTFGGALLQAKNAFGNLFEAQGGLGDAKEALQELTAVLRDPATLEAADTLTTGLIKGLAQITRLAVGATDGIRGLLGGATELEKLRDQLSHLQDTRDSVLPVYFNFGYIDGADTVLGPGALDKEIERIRSRIEAINAPALTKGHGPIRARGPAEPFVAPPSEEFEKLNAQLAEQLALFGKTGEAAKIAYQIQSGALDDLSDSEQKQVLALAKHLDALTAQAAAAKEAEQAQKALTATYEGQVKSLEEQIALGADATEAERARYETTRGELAKLTTAQKDHLVQLAEERDLQEDITKAEAEWTKERERGKDLTESLRTPQEQYAATLKDINKLLLDGAIGYQTYGRALTKAQDELDEATNKWTVFKDQAARNSQDIIADTLVNGFKDGADGVLDAFGDMITQLVAQAIAADIGGKLFGKSGGGTGEGWIGMAFDYLGGLAGGRAAGGQTSVGSLYRVNETRDEYFSPRLSGEVIPLGSGSQGGGARITQNINVAGRPDSRTARQMQVQAARQQRIATARLG
jgi:hypothetical protein